MSAFVTVVDENQRFVSGLTKEDFELYDNSKIQTVTAFETTPGPLNVVVMLDTSGSMKNVLESAKGAIAEFLGRLSSDDSALVAGFNDKVTFKPDSGFTASLDRIKAGLAQLPYGFPSAIYDALGGSIERLIATRGRRVVVVMTDGEDNASKLTAGEVSKKANEANVSVYTMGLLNVYMNQSSSMNMTTGQQTFYPPERHHTSVDRGLKKLSAETGGGVLLLKNVTDWSPAFAGLMAELHGQYKIAFSPLIRDTKLHKLEVRVKRAGMTVRSRNTYSMRTAS